jgi:hypothetical protein
VRAPGSPVGHARFVQSFEAMTRSSTLVAVVFVVFVACDRGDSSSHQIAGQFDMGSDKIAPCSLVTGALLVPSHIAVVGAEKAEQDSAELGQAITRRGECVIPFTLSIAGSGPFRLTLEPDPPNDVAKAWGPTYTLDDLERANFTLRVRLEEFRLRALPPPRSGSPSPST